MVERLPGTATASGSTSTAQRFGGPGRVLPGPGIVVAPVGLGTAGSRLDDPEHRRSVADALRAGVNFVDLDLDAPPEASPALVRTMLRTAIAHEGLSREGVVLAGHTRVSTLERLDAAVEAGLDALGVAHLDVLSVPLSTFTNDATGTVRYLRAQLDLGRIGGYGVRLDRVGDLDAVLDLVAAVPGLAFVRTPLGVLDLGTAAPRIARARAAGLFVIGVGPLSVHTDDGSTRLRLTEPESPSWIAAKAALGRVRRLEARWAAGLGARLVIGEGQDDAADLFAWGQVLATRLAEFDSLEAWQTARYEVIAPHLGRTSAALLQSLPDEPRADFGHWWTEYGSAMHEAFDAIEAALRTAPRDLSSALGQRLASHLPESWRAWSLAKQAVSLVAASDVDVVVVGMRRPSHVHEIIGLREEEGLWTRDGTAERPSPAEVQAISGDLAEFAQTLPLASR